MMGEFKKMGLVFLIATLVVITGFGKWGEQQFVDLARSFLVGKTYFTNKLPDYGDTVFWGGKYYWPAGPVPALILVPLARYEKLTQGLVQVPLVLLIAFLVYVVGRRLGYKQEDAVFWSVAFCAGSVFLGVALWPWCRPFVQVISTLLIWLAIIELTGKKRYGLIGVWMGLLFLSRPVPAFGIVYFAASVFVLGGNRGANLVKLLLPLVISIMVWGGYNQARFGNWFDDGFSRALFPTFSEKAKGYGLFNTIHLPGNLYYLFLAGPDPVFRGDGSHVLKFPFMRVNEWGMSIFLTSPCVLWLFSRKGWTAEMWRMLVTIFVIAAPLMVYFSLGYRQYGYRYSLDFLPWVYLLLMVKLKGSELGRGFKWVVVISTIFNMYMFGVSYLWLMG